MSRGAVSDTDTARSGRAAAGYSTQVPAVDQAAGVLYYLAAVPSGEANLTQICRAVDIHLSKGHAILGTLRSTGLVVRSQGKMYALGPGVLTLSRSVLDRTGLATAADLYLADLAALYRSDRSSRTDHRRPRVHRGPQGGPRDARCHDPGGAPLSAHLGSPR